MVFDAASPSNNASSFSIGLRSNRNHPPKEAKNAHPPQLADEAPKRVRELALHPQRVVFVHVGLKGAREENLEHGDGVHEALQRAVHEARVAEVLQSGQSGARARALADRVLGRVGRGGAAAEAGAGAGAAAAAGGAGRRAERDDGGRRARVVGRGALCVCFALCCFE